MAGASLVYVSELFGITVAGNVPLNNLLDAVNLNTATDEQLSQLRKAFEIPWNRWHAIRMVAVVVSFLMAVIAVIVPQK